MTIILISLFTLQNIMEKLIYRGPAEEQMILA